MILFRRPKQPEDFDLKVKKHREGVHASMQDGGDGNPEFKEVWKEYKSYFSEAQGGHCGYCCIQVTGGQPGDVEHYAPKGAIYSILNHGTEEAHVSKVTGRTFNKLSTRGYWWLAYSWENYLLCCATCNQVWKNSLFPLRGGDITRTIPPHAAQKEHPLLLSPYGKRNPSVHLRFGRLGEIEAIRKSPYGRATIEVCGLDRPSLRTSRAEVVKETQDLLADLLLDDLSDREEKRILRSLLRDGSLTNGGFPGVVRCVFEQSTGLPWSTLEERCKEAGIVI